MSVALSTCQRTVALALFLTPWVVLYPAYAQTDQSAQTTETPALKKVRVQPLETLVGRIERTAPARVVSLNHAKVAAEISARLTAINVRVGDTVVAGDTVATLDCSDYDRATLEARARLDANESRRKLAQQQLERARRLAKSNAVSEDALNQRQAEFNVAIADIAAQRAQLDRAVTAASRCTVTAPFTAVVTQRNGQVGEYTTPGAVIVTLVDTTNVELSAQVADKDASTLSVAAPARFRYDNREFAVTARTILPVIDDVTRSRETRFAFTSERANVGASGRIVWTLSTSALPSTLVTTYQNQLGVFTLDKDVVRFIPLPNAIEGRPAQIDLPVTTRIVTEGRRALSDGESVIVVE